MGRFIDITDKRFGKIVAIERSKHEYRRKHGFWLCRCDCGVVKEIYGGHLRSGKTQTCGCYSQLIDISGERFGLLTVECLDCIGKHNESRWTCRCECGKCVVVSKSNLYAGNVKSCRCKSAELQEQTNILKYGTKSSFQNKAVRDKFEENNIKKYGVPYPAQDPVIALKIAKSQRNSFILTHWATGEEIVCVASYEKRTVESFNRKCINFTWQSKVFAMPDGRTYRPDLYLPDKDLWVEIKGYFRDDAKEKWEWFHKEYPNSELWDKKILEQKGII